MSNISLSYLCIKQKNNIKNYNNRTLKMEKKHYLIVTAAASALLLTSCSGKLGQLTADNFKVTPNPLEAHQGQVGATINGMFPEKYMNKKAVVTVTPQLRYGDRKVALGTPATFQGEKVMGNDQTISYKLGGNYSMRTNFDYVDEMQKSELYLTFDAKIGKKSVEVPAVKVANGVVATSELYKKTVKTAAPCIAPDAFQRVTAAKQTANIKFLIQQATLRQSELKNNSVTEFVDLLQRINKDQEGLCLNNVEVSAYASPDGGYKLNDKLANQRQQNTEKYVEGQLKKTDIEAPIDAKYTAQDWEGFQELVAASNIQDKEVILRVLSMYKDPEEREQQIKNMSAGFRELADGILPELRRARLTINYEVIGRDDEHIEAQLKSDASKLSVEEMLYAATLKETADEQEEVYKKTTALYPNDARAYNNIAAIEYSKGNLTAANEYLLQAQKRDAKGTEANANLALIALQQGDVATAENYMLKAGNNKGMEEMIGNVYLAKCNYAMAEQAMAKVNSNSAALAQILNKNYAAAANTLDRVAQKDGMTYYLKAVLCARQGQNNEAAVALRKAIEKDASLKAYAANDLELAKIAK